MLEPRQPLKWPQALTAHRGWLSAVIFARVRDRDAVDEILQETALAAVTGNCPSDTTGISRWLYRVAVRQSVLYRRKKGRTEKRPTATRTWQFPGIPNNNGHKIR